MVHAVSWHQRFRQRLLPVVAPERRFWATLLASSSPFHPFLLRKLPQGTAAGRVNTLMVLICHPTGGWLPTRQPGFPTLPTPPGGRLWTPGPGPLHLRGSSPLCLYSLIPLPAPVGQCPQCQSAAPTPTPTPKREAKARPLRSPQLKPGKVLAPSPTSPGIRSQQLRRPPPASASPISQNSFIMPISSSPWAADSCQQK